MRRSSIRKDVMLINIYAPNTGALKQANIELQRNMIMYTVTPD